MQRVLCVRNTRQHNLIIRTIELHRDATCYIMFVLLCKSTSYNYQNFINLKLQSHTLIKLHLNDHT